VRWILSRLDVLLPVTAGTATASSLLFVYEATSGNVEDTCIFVGFRFLFRRHIHSPLLTMLAQTFTKADRLEDMMDEIEGIFDNRGFRRWGLR